MSKTPRTDDREFAAIDVKPSSRVVYASLARQLETELADAKAEIARLREKIKRCSTCKHCLPDNEMIEVCLNEARCCRTSARCVIDRTSSEKRASWPDLWEEGE